MKRLLMLAPLLALGGCVTTGGSVTGGECKVFERPPYVVRGVTQYDQDWADSTVASGVGGCKWERPAARPAELDAMPLPKPRPIVKKRNWIKRIKAKIWPVSATPVFETPITPAPSSPPRSAVDELLHPDGEK